MVVSDRCHSIYLYFEHFFMMRNFFLTVAGLQPTCSNATNHEFLTKFFTGVLKILGNLQEELRNEDPFK